MKLETLFAQMNRSNRSISRQRDDLIVSALIEIARLKLIDIEGVDMTGLFAVEDTLMNELADARDDNPRLALGVSPRMIYRVHQRLIRLIDPNGSRSEQATIEIINNVLEHAYFKVRNQEQLNNEQHTNRY